MADLAIKVDGLGKRYRLGARQPYKRVGDLLMKPLRRATQPKKRNPYLWALKDVSFEVKQGEMLTVTEHGLEVALLRPLPPTTDIVGRLVAEGRASRPTRSLRDLPRPLASKLKKPLSRIIVEMRDDERY